ncbi:MAG TPA: DEAD/DEAH box helicase [Polyangiaceae bacterium]|nr:DEAD/DEAH box helicase [Polyangiaceae bacterium]
MLDSSSASESTSAQGDEPSSPLDYPPCFQPATVDWFRSQFGSPTEAQSRTWAALREGGPVLLAAPTGSGKTLAAFLSALDDLLREGLEAPLPDETRVLYVSPLKALSADIALNLERPLAGLSAASAARGAPPPTIRTHVRTGDTSAKERARATRTPPHIQVTTPESLYVLLTSEGGRRQLAGVRTVIVDEIHALLRDKRGSHLALSLERLDALVHARTGRFPQRVGLSATQRPVELVARFLTGERPGPPCRIVDTGHRRKLELSLWVPPSPLQAVMSNDTWLELYDELARLVSEHRTTLVFVNTRRMAERATRFLAERLGEGAVTSHHGSLSRELRRDAETRLKTGKLRALVATASLELGIDVGEVDRVVQLGSPGNIATFLQRVGRSGHSIDGTPRGTIFPLSRDDLVESSALLHAVRQGELETCHVVEAPLDVLAQQIVASAVPEDLDEDALYARVRSAYPYRALGRGDFDAVVAMLSEGYVTSRGRRAAWLHHDTTERRLRARRGARIAALTNGGAIPENFDYDVLLAPADQRVGSLHEDFAIEASAGDIFQLGNQSYQILRIGAGTVHVADAHGAPPTIPFWIGEAPGRSDELSSAVARLREWVDEHGEAPEAASTLAERTCAPLAAAEQVLTYLLATRNALGVMPTQKRIVAERFFDETGGMHVVVHAPFGSRFLRAYGLALRKRFCRSFNVELQAAATDEALVLSLGPMHSFPLESVFEFLRSNSAHDVLVQALLDAPLFGTRFRWNASRALAVLRFRGGKKVPPRFQRMDSDDLLALCFPDQVACLENIVGDRNIPDHPLVRQTLDDALHEALDADEFMRVLRDIEAGNIQCFARDLVEPSPLSHEVLSAKPYAFLDDAPLEERRTQAINMRRFVTPDDAAQLGVLDPEAIVRVLEESRPDPRDPDELHDALTVHGFAREAEGLAWQQPSGRDSFGPLVERQRALRLEVPTSSGVAVFWVARERLAEFLTLHPGASGHGSRLAAELGLPPSKSTGEPWLDLFRGRLSFMGPTTVEEFAESAAVTPDLARAGLAALEQEGLVLRGSFRTGAGEEFCERRLLARIHRLTLGRLRREIEPVSAAEYIDFLFAHQGLLPGHERRGVEGLWAVLQQLDGFALAASAWESQVLPARVVGYDPAYLDALCLDGRAAWAAVPRESSGPVKSTPIRILPRDSLDDWHVDGAPWLEGLGADARRLADLLEARHAVFFSELQRGTGLLPTQAENALRELISRGACTTDTFAGLRTLLLPEARRRQHPARGRRGPGSAGLGTAGRIGWLASSLGDDSTMRAEPSDALDAEERLQRIAWRLLRRWGVVQKRVLERETGLPPWRDLVRTFYRLEARGEIRGGRFVTGFSGEQFALPDAVSTLRARRRLGPNQEPTVVSAVDPLNVAGVLTPDGRVAALATHRLLWRAGRLVGTFEGGKAELLDSSAGPQAPRWLELLRLGHAPASDPLRRRGGREAFGPLDSPHPS